MGNGVVEMILHAPDPYWSGYKSVCLTRTTMRGQDYISQIGYDGILERQIWLTIVMDTSSGEL